MRAPSDGGGNLGNRTSLGSADNTQLVRLGLSSVSQSDGGESLHWYWTVWGELSDTEIDSGSQLQTLDRMALAFMHLFQVCDRKFECMQDFDSQLQLPNAYES